MRHVRRLMDPVEQGWKGMAMQQALSFALPESVQVAPSFGHETWSCGDGSGIVMKNAAAMPSRAEIRPRAVEQRRRASEQRPPRGDVSRASPTQKANFTVRGFTVLLKKEELEQTQPHVQVRGSQASASSVALAASSVALAATTAAVALAASPVTLVATSVAASVAAISCERRVGASRRHRSRLLRDGRGANRMAHHGRRHAHRHAVLRRQCLPP